MVVSKNREWIKLLFYGSLWGITEVLIENFIVPVCPVPRSIILTTVAMGILTIAQIDLKQSGCILVIGVIAALYKFLNIRFFGCQILALLLLTGSFEIINTWLKDRKLSRGATAAIVVFIFNTVFAVIATYVLRNFWWVAGGAPKILNFIFIESSITAVFAYGICNLVQYIMHNYIQGGVSRFQKLKTATFFDCSYIFFAASAAIIVVIL